MDRLYRSIDNRIIAGVAGGIGEFYNIDPTIIRIVWAVITIIPPITFFSILAYILAWILIPEEGKGPGAGTPKPRTEEPRT
ncbi:MAG TPA: PspC domain-containing protein [Methanomicrobiales archaeon]|nr:PspC domain-containing protein [Methanomicrobiales archaeon]